jgi:hypothetical protein
MNATTPAHMRELTDWFPADVKPVRIGVYETRDELGALWFNYWTGDRWSWGVTPHGIQQGAWPKKTGCASCQYRKWRGLREPA